MKNLFTKASLQRHKEEKSVVRDVSGKMLEEISPGASESLWTNDPIGTGLKNTQQLLVDWSKFEEHVFFNSAEAKVNLAYDNIINGFPFDGTAAEKKIFLADIGGFEKYIYDQFDTNLGYFNFDGNVYLSIEDLTGKLAPDIANTIGLTKTTKSVDLSGMTIEFWIYVPNATSNVQQVIYQKANADTNPSTEGVTVFRSAIAAGKYKLSYMISSDKYKSIVHTIPNLETDKWHHIAYTYHIATTERVTGYLNGVQHSYTENYQAELDDITMGGKNINIGNGIRHTTYDPNAEAGTLTSTNPSKFVGLLDELRVWLGVRTAKEIKDNYKRNVSAESSLLLYYRFNEPSFTTNAYQAQQVVLDYSGNSLHTKFTDWDPAHDPKKRYVSGSTTIETPLILEKLSDNPVLFPDWVPNVTVNKQLIHDANHYDRNNPNLITKLVPQHYFDQALAETGFGEELEEGDYYGSQDIDYPLPGNGKMPARIVMFSFLMIWANFFDDIKLFLDSFSTINKVSYDTYNQVPPQVIQFLSDYYGVELPNPYANEAPSRYKEGDNLQTEAGLGTPLETTLDTLWRRILINLPHLLRTRGTIAGVKALMNTIGIEADSVFRFKEYGGNLTKKIQSRRTRKKKKSQYIDFSKATYVESSPIWAYRHEPGDPDPSSAPTSQEILFQSGDITIVKPAVPPKPMLFTSGSWSWEGRYKLLQSELTSSLFRIEKNNDILVNLVAYRAADNEGVDYNLKLFIDGTNTSSSQTILSLPNVNLWDDNHWYISIANEWGDTKNTVSLRCIRTVENYIVEHHSGSIEYSKGSAASSTAGSTTTYNPNIPLFETDDSGTPTQNNVKWYVGKNNKSYGSTWNNNPVSLTTGFSGSISHMRLWTKNLERSEQIEHAYNPFSVATTNPTKSYAFPNAPILELKGGQNVETPLGKYSGLYAGTLPEGSWARIRHSFDMLQSGSIFDSGQLKLVDTTQNGDDATIYGVTGGLAQEEFFYTITNPEIDSNSSDNKVRIRSYQDRQSAIDNFAEHGVLTQLPFETGVDDRRFSIESSLVHALNEDMVNVVGNSEILNNFLGDPTLDYAVDYPELRKLNDIYFRRIVGKVNYNSIIEFQRWFNNNFAALVESFIPHTADFLGINFIIESHLLERHKMEYKQGDVHVDIKDRQAFSQEPLFLGTIRTEIT